MQSSLACRRLAVALAAVASLVACDRGSAPPDRGSPAMVIVGGQNQRDTVLVQLSELIDVVAGHRRGTPSMTILTGPGSAVGADTLVENLTPIVGAVVSFVVPDPRCGRPFAGSALTNAQGHAKERWELGTKAGLCVMEARLVDQTTGAALVVDSIHATILPGAARTLTIRAEFRGSSRHSPYGGFAVGDTVALPALLESAADAHGNSFTPANLQWTVQDSMLRPDSPTWVWRDGPAVIGSAGVWRLYLRADSAITFTWIRVPDAQ